MATRYLNYRANVSDAPKHDAVEALPFDLAGRVRIALRLAWLFAILVVCLPPHLAYRLARRPSPWARRFLRGAARASGIRVSVTGTVPTRSVFIVANHLSWTDITIIGGLVETRFVAQDAIAGWPFVGWLARLNDTIFVSRTDRSTATDQVRRLRDAIAGDRPVTLFPEGTTTDGDSLLPFKSVLFEGLDPLPRPLLVQPVLLDFDAAGCSLAWIGTEGANANAARTLGRRGSYGVQVHFLEPFDPCDYPGRKAIAAETRKRIATALAAATGHPIA